MGPIKMNFLKKIFMLCLALIVWEVTTSCGNYSTYSPQCFGYWIDEGPKRGTLSKNRLNNLPYRQCVQETPPHKNM
jgi:hypothetical protein